MTSLLAYTGPDKTWACPDCDRPMRGPASDPELQCVVCAVSRARRGDMLDFVYAPGEHARTRAARRRVSRYLDAREKREEEEAAVQVDLEQWLEGLV